MKRNAKSRGSGGRLRLTLLLATAAAFLLVPAAVASAAPKVIIKTAGTGSGKVVGEEPFAGKPPINCEWNGTAQSGTCEAEALEVEPGLWAALVNHEAASGSEFIGWKVESGTNLESCEEEKPSAGECSAVSFGEDIVIKATFKKIPVKNVHIVFAGKGSGKVVGVPGTGEGTPPVNCEWNGETETKSGTCDVEWGGPNPPFLHYIYLEEKVAPGSVFAEWKILKGKEFGGGCFPATISKCVAGTLSGSETEIEVRATFTPPPIALTINTSGGTGSGQVNCKVNGGSTDSPCHAEYPKGTNLELISAPSAGSQVGTVSGTGSASGCASLPCTFTLNAASTVNAPFNLISEPVSVSQEGTGSVECEDTATPGFGACGSYPYGHTINVKATPAAEQQLGSISGGGSALGKCTFGAIGTCSFVIHEASSVTVKFVPASETSVKTAKVEGKVPQTTELATTDCGTVYLGEFKPLALASPYHKTCTLTVTSTGAETALTAADLSGEAEIGHLVNHEKGGPYSLKSALETKATDTEELGGVGGSLAKLTSPVTLLTYAVPVNADNVTLEFNQPIGSHDPLRTGVYAKTITLTLKQTTP